MHCFSGSKEMATQCIDLGLYISFAGTVTYHNARKLQEIAAWIDLDKMLLETDCPWLAPQKVRGKRNEPAFLIYTAETIARIKELSLEEIATSTTKNAQEVFTLI
jgi:TatD DNase family protein